MALLRNLIFFVRYVSLEKIEAQGSFKLYCCALYGTQRVAYFFCLNTAEHLFSNASAAFCRPSFFASGTNNATVSWAISLRCN